MRFRQISTILEVFSRISPLGNAPKMTIRKQVLLPSFSRISSKKWGIFHEKTLFSEKLADLTRKRREFFVANFCIFEKSGEFFRFWISEAATLLDDFEKYTKNFNLWFFDKKSWWAEKGEFHFFQKTRFFAKTLFAIFYCGGLMPKWKNKVEKCPVRNINFCV